VALRRLSRRAKTMRHRRTDRDGDLVYSTEPDALCPECGLPAPRCRCGKTKSVPAGDGIVRVGRQSRGRRGKGVTVITGVPLAGAGLAKLAKRLKRLCGSGGCVKDGAIEVQGDHRDRLVEVLQGEGWRVKRAGG